MRRITCSLQKWVALCPSLCPHSCTLTCGTLSVPGMPCNDSSMWENHLHSAFLEEAQWAQPADVPTAVRVWCAGPTEPPGQWGGPQVHSPAATQHWRGEAPRAKVGGLAGAPGVISVPSSSIWGWYEARRPSSNCPAIHNFPNTWKPHMIFLKVVICSAVHPKIGQTYFKPITKIN